MFVSCSLVGNPGHFGMFDQYLYCCTPPFAPFPPPLSKFWPVWGHYHHIKKWTPLVWLGWLGCNEGQYRPKPLKVLCFSLFFPTEDCEGVKKRVINCWTYKRVDDDSFKCPSLCHCLHVVWASFVTVKNLLICARSLFQWKSHEMYFALQNEQK